MNQQPGASRPANDTRSTPSAVVAGSLKVVAASTRSRVSAGSAPVPGTRARRPGTRRCSARDAGSAPVPGIPARRLTDQRRRSSGAESARAPGTRARRPSRTRLRRRLPPPRPRTRPRPLQHHSRSQTHNRPGGCRPSFRRMWKKIREQSHDHGCGEQRARHGRGNRREGLAYTRAVGTNLGGLNRGAHNPLGRHRRHERGHRAYVWSYAVRRTWGPPLACRLTAADRT